MQHTSKESPAALPDDDPTLKQKRKEPERSGSDYKQPKQVLSLLIGLIVAGLAGNYFKFPIFLNIDFLFGSIFAILALQLLGWGRGVLAAAFIAGYTYFLWNHPYAIIIMTAEVAVVGYLIERRTMGVVLADTLYWLVIGMPLVFLFYHVVMHVPPSNTYIAMTKQAMNGIANALIARLIFTAFVLWSQSSLLSYREIIYNLLTFFVLFPTLIMLAIGSKTDFNETDNEIRTTLMQDSQLINQRLKTWVQNRKSAIINLAEMAASRSPQQMQPYLEQSKKSDVNLLRIGLLDREATITAYYPLLDEFGKQNIGKNFADRPFIPVLKRTLRPMLSEVVMGRIGNPQPMVTMLAPVVIRGSYSGYISGILNLVQIREHLEKSAERSTMLYSLIDKNGNVIMSNRANQQVMKPFVRDRGTFQNLENGVGQWVPVVAPNTPISERWRKSYYVVESTIGDLSEWKLILEQPVAPFQKKLYDNYTGKLGLLFLILLGSLGLTELLSRKIVVTLERLSMLTNELPVKLAANDAEMAWPDTSIKESSHLIGNFRGMACSLIAKFNEVKQIAEEASEARQQLLDIIDFYPDATFVINNDKKVIVWNSAMEKMSGVSKAEMIGKGDFAYTVPFYGERRKNLLDLLDERLEDLTSRYKGIVRTKNTLSAETFCPALYGGKGAFVWAVVAPLLNTKGVRVGAIESIRDTTDRRQAQDRLEQAYAEVETRVRERTAQLDKANLELTAEIAERNKAEQQMREAMNYIDTLLRTSPVGIATYKVTGEAVSVNEAAAQIVGTTVDKMMQQNFLGLASWQRSGLLELAELALATATEQRRDIHMLTTFGNQLDLDCLFVPFIFNGEQHLMLLAIDCTERKRAELALAKVEKLESIGTLAAGIAHDFNNLLGIMFGYLELSQMTAEKTQQQEIASYLAQARSAFDRAKDLTGQLLTFSKGGAPIRKTQSLSDLVQRTISFSLSGSNVAPEYSIPDGIWLSDVDENQIAQVLDNMVINARQAMPQGGLLNVSLHKIAASGAPEMLPPQDYVCISVRDHGTGIAAEHLPHIFDPFFTTKNMGSGLGLATSYSIIRQHDGFIDVDSVLGRGTTFHIYLPAKLGSVVSVTDDNPKTRQGKGRILIMDDEDMILDMLALMLENMGYLAVKTHHGKEAKETMKKALQAEEHFAAAILDLTIPSGLGGKDTVYALLALDPTIKVIASSGYANDPIMANPTDFGFAGRLTKPYRRSDLTAVLGSVQPD